MSSTTITNSNGITLQWCIICFLNNFPTFDKAITVQSDAARGAYAYQMIISNNSHAHDEQGVNPGQVGRFDGVLCKL